MKFFLLSTKKSIDKILIPFFGNTLGLPVNYKWLFYHLKCRFFFQGSLKTELKEAVRQFKNERLCKIGDFPLSDLAIKVSEYFRSLNSDVSHEDIPPLIQKEYGSLLYEALSKVSPFIEMQYGSYFQPYWVAIQQSLPGVEDLSSSDSWHIDDNPKPMLKIFFYLNEVNEWNGAFRAFPWKYSKLLLSRGFKSYNPETRIKNQSMVNEFFKENRGKLRILEGKQGAALLFDNNLVHKGTLPKKSYRHVVQILIYPSVKPMTIDMVRNALESPRLWDYPKNPSLNDYGGLLGEINNI